MVGNSGRVGDGSGVDAIDCNRSSVLLESNESLLGSANGTSGRLTGVFAFLKENGLVKSNGSPNWELGFAFGNSSTDGTTGTNGDEGEPTGGVSSVSGGWGGSNCKFL